MHIEHCVFLSWFSANPEGHEQDGEKLSRRPAKRDANSVWRSCHGIQNLALSQEANIFGSCLSPAARIAAGPNQRMLLTHSLHVKRVGRASARRTRD